MNILLKYYLALQSNIFYASELLNSRYIFLIILLFAQHICPKLIEVINYCLKQLEIEVPINIHVKLKKKK